MPIKKTEQKSGLSTTSLVLAIVWLVLCITVIGALIWIPLAILALIFGIIALVKKQKKGTAIAGVVIWGLVTLIWLALAIFGTIFVKNNADVLMDPIMHMAEMVEADPELEELMENPTFQAEFQYLFQQRITEKFGDMEDVEGWEESKQYIPQIFAEMEIVILELKEKYKTQ